MTELVKFPGTDNPAPEEVYIQSDGAGFVELSGLYNTSALKYVRADTVIPNDHVWEIVIKAMDRSKEFSDVGMDSERGAIALQVLRDYKSGITDASSDSD